MDKARITFLGTGTSQGLPIIGCECAVCSSDDPKDKRLRASVFVEYRGLNILVDAGPDFRYQMLRAGIRHLDAILLTHHHKDHTGGLDDVRAFNYIEKRPTEIYCEKYVEKSLRKEYSYAFAKRKYPGAPEWNIHIVDEHPFTVSSDSGKSAEIIPIRGMHGKIPVLGYRFGDIAYCTDMNFIPDSEFGKLRGLEHFVLNCVKRGKHISHFSIEEATQTAERVGAKHTWLTHLSHRLPQYRQLCAELPDGIAPAYDGLVIDG